MLLPLHSPLVISASRATDIPAFHGEWFMARLRAGFCRRRNPFNSRQESLISFARTRVFVFWSKHPAPFLPHLAEIAATGRQFYFQYTLNAYEAEGLGPACPPCAAVWRRSSGWRTASARSGSSGVAIPSSWAAA